MLLASIFLGAESILPLYVDSLPRGLFALLTFFSIIGGVIARLIIQQIGDDDDKA